MFKFKKSRNHEATSRLRGKGSITTLTILNNIIKIQAVNLGGQLKLKEQ